MDTTQQILATMLAKDHFSKWLGIVVDDYKEGYCKLHFTIRQEMLNGFGTVHGGVLFSVADSAFAFACNSAGRLSVALDANISFIKAGKEGDTLLVTAQKLHLGNKTGFYDVTVANEGGELVAVFKGTAYVTSKYIL